MSSASRIESPKSLTVAGLFAGIGGIEGKQIEHTLIEANVIRRCGWQNIWPLYETGGIKVHCTRSCLLWHNFIADTVGAPGIWMDYANVNSRCSANVIVNAACENGGIFMEASQQPNLVDEVAIVSDEEAVTMIHSLWREGFFAGVSSGANVLVALREARKNGRSQHRNGSGGQRGSLLHRRAFCDLMIISKDLLRERRMGIG
jgi:hypothetical protein